MNHQNAHARLFFGNGVVRIADRPRIDTAAREGSSGIGGRQLDRLDVGEGQPYLLQRRHRQVVLRGATRKGNAPALQVCQRLQG